MFGHMTFGVSEDGAEIEVPQLLLQYGISLHVISISLSSLINSPARIPESLQSWIIVIHCDKLNKRQQSKWLFVG